MLLVKNAFMDALLSPTNDIQRVDLIISENKHENLIILKNKTEKEGFIKKNSLI